MPTRDSEAARLACLHSYQILDSPVETAFDNLALLAATVSGAPLAGIALIDRHRVWFKARVGFAGLEVKRSRFFAPDAVWRGGKSTKGDELARSLAVDRQDAVRFYSGTPLIADSGHVVGALCVMDHEPRDLNEPTALVLKLLAGQVVALMDQSRSLHERSILLERNSAAARELADSSSRMHEFMDRSPMLAFMKDHANRYVYVNKQYEQVCGITLDEVWGATDFEIFPPDIASQFRANDQLVRSTGQAIETIETSVTPDGVSRSWSVSKFPFTDPVGGESVGGVAIDVTERVRAEVAALEARSALEASQARLEEAQRVAQIGSWEYELSTRQLTWSAEVFRLMDFDPEGPVPDLETVSDRLHPDDRGLHARALKQALEEGRSYDLELRVVLDDGTLRWLHAIGQPATGADGGPARLIGTLRNITQAKVLTQQLADANAYLEQVNKLLIEQQASLVAGHQQLETLAATDGLTGLKNRAALQEKLAEEFERCSRHSRPLSILMLDVDEFKRFNDTFGHTEGDAVLRRVGAILLRTARATDYVARYGGEEFMVLLPETDAGGATLIAERLRRTVERDPWSRRQITISIGVASLDILTTSSSALVNEADSAMYESKARGRNRVTLFHAEASDRFDSEGIAIGPAYWPSVR